ncbi:hypothetical protein ACFY1P_32870 [Streptomyces sp. NPDC001407]|uniref:hypothetical protein n=1 Tax=Streptomyces sp. NPDC001407 TaxID=3364573 RepID=UPI0036CD537B
MNALLAAAPGIIGGKLLGTITVVGIAVPATIAFVAGLRGSDTIKINNKKKAAWWGVVIGNLWVAAGGTLADIANGVGAISKGVLGGDELFGSSPGLGGVALILAACAWAPKWKRMVWPAIFGLATGVVMPEVGGLWGIIANVIRMVLATVVTKVTGS